MDEFGGADWATGEPDYAVSSQEPPLAPAAVMAMRQQAAAPMPQQGPPMLAPPRRHELPPDQRYAPPAHQPPPVDALPPLARRSAMGATAAPESGSHMLGFALLAVSIGTIVGIKYGGGVWGGAAGALAGGSVVNGVRAVRMAVRGDAQSDREAIISGTYTVLGLGVAGYLLYKTRSDRKAELSKAA